MHNSVTRINMEIILNNKERYAEEFSEGEKILKLCLLDLWNNKIYTSGCCIGHEDDDSVSYIGIDLKNSNINNLMNLLNNINKENVRLGFTSDNDKYGCSISSLNKNDNILFENIINTLKKDKNEKNNYDFIKTLDIIKNTSYKYITIQYIYKKNNLVQKYCITNNQMIIDDYKNKYISKIYNEKNNYIYFDLLNESKTTQRGNYNEKKD